MHTTSVVTTHSPVRSQPSNIWLIAGMLGLIAVTQAGSYFVMDAGWPLLLGMSATLGWFVYAYVSEFHLIIRRLIASTALKESGWVFKPVSRALFYRFGLFTLSLFFSGSFLLHANQMPLYIWALVYADVFILMGLLRLFRGSVDKVAKPGFSEAIQRKGVFWTNIVLLTMIICAVSFFMPVADTSHLSALEAGRMAFDQVWQSAADPIVGAWGGMMAGADAALWNIMQQLSQVNFNVTLKILIWIGFFVMQGFYLWVIQSAMLGVMVIGQKDGSLSDRILGKSSASKWFWGVFYLLIAIWLVLSLALDSQQQSKPGTISLNFIESPELEKIVIDPCKGSASEDSAAVNQTLNDQLIQDSSVYEATIDPYIDTQVNQAFAHAVNGVDAYLDWYFTVYGEWQRLLTVVGGDISKLMQEKMTSLILKDSGFEHAIHMAQGNISSQVTQQFTQATTHMMAMTKQQVEIHPCAMDQKMDVALPSLSRDMNRIALTASTTAAAGAAIGMGATAAITSKLAATASVKLAVKILTKAAAKTVVKTASGTAGAGLGAMVGLSCGPAVIFCSGVGALVGFFGVDALFMEGDELLNRQDMRNDMIQSLIAQRNQIKAQQKALYHKTGNKFFSKISNKAHAYFIPAKQGM